MLKASLLPRRSLIATMVMVGVVASALGALPTKNASTLLAENCPNAPTTPTFNYWPVTYDDVNTPFCHDYPAIDGSVSQANPQWSTSQADWENGLSLNAGQEGAAGIYIHNGASNNLDPAQTTARNVHIITRTDTSVGTTHPITVTFTADNAASYTRTFNVHTPANSKLEVIPNSGGMYDYHGRLILDQQNLNLGNSDFALGDLDACFEFSLFLTFRFKVVTETPQPTNTTLSIDKKVKNLTTNPGTGRGAVYYDSVNAKKGEKVAYRTVVTNTGSTVARNVTVTDPGVSGISITPGYTLVGLADDAILPGNLWSGSIPGTVNLGDLQPGESRTILYEGTVTSDICTPLVNTARAVATNAPQVSNSATVVVTDCAPIGNPGLVISKLVKNNTYARSYADTTDAKNGDSVNFKIAITNTGNQNLNSAVITDVIPAGLQFDNSVVTDGTSSFANNTLTVNFNSPVAPGQTKTVEFAVKVTANPAPGTTQSICNIARANGSGVNQVEADACVIVTTPFVGNPGLSITKLVRNLTTGNGYADSTAAKNGERVNFKLTITNTGNANLNNAVITDVIPAGLQFDDSVVTDGSASFANNTLTVSFASPVAPGQSKTVEFAAKVTANPTPGTSTTICNVATATGTGVNQVSADACVIVSTPFVGNPGLTITKLVKNQTAGNSYADVTDAKTGDRVNFKLTITNTGNADLVNAVITDVMPAGIQFDDSVVTDGISSFTNNTLIVTFGSPLAPGQSKTVEFAAKVTASAAAGTTNTICNVAKATGNAVNQVQADACVKITTPPNPTNPKIAIKKWVKNINANGAYNDSFVDSRTGERVMFKVTVSNTGDAVLNNVVMTDRIPAGLTFDDSVTGDGTANFAGETFTVNFGSINAGQSKTVEFAAKVVATGETSICNIAKATGTGVSEVSDDACVKVYTTPKPGESKIVLSKRAFNDTKNVDATTRDADRGDYITYSLVVVNNGTETEKNFVIKDDLSKVLPLADMVSTNGGTLSGNMITYPAMDIKPGETVVKTFKVRIKQTLDKNLAYQLENTYGNTVIIKVPGKIVYEAPKTGAAGTSAGIFAGLLTAGFVIARKRDSILKFIFA